MNEIDKFVMDQENEDEFMSNIEKQGIKVDDSTIYKYLQLDSRRSSRASQINHSISIKKDKNKQELIELDSPSIKEKKIKKLIEIVKEK
jgi:IS30 family transposase